ncbi:hypothetical protein [Nesterenkonia aerolata]|uniref:Secreted protein n=1 Tax=Nesterenkonia aerolata TaxID=3074079 RepID=A0ABU2DSF1_9MICC|nr:hypothetical protein [Nesterenkonia sp. LY-0111]MDR8019225.1 hypothetical protein [Nesterenkonia sp. LY-0111]
MTMNYTPKAITGLSLAALLALTACGDGDNDTSNGSEDNTDDSEETAAEVFDFEAPMTESNHGPYDEVTIQVPDELLESDPEYAESRTLDSVTLRAAERDEPGKCAMEATHVYSENVPDQPEDSRIASTGFMAANFSGTTGSALAHKDSGWDIQTLAELEGKNEGLYLQQRPEVETYSMLLGRESKDALNEERFSEDYSTFTYNLDCDGVITLRFPTVEVEDMTIEDAINAPDDALDDDGEVVEGYQQLYDEAASNAPDSWTRMSFTTGENTFAQVEASIDSEGNITLYAPGVDGWEYDSNGNWVAR